MTYDINTKTDLKHAMKEHGSHFFDRATIRFFSSKLHNVYGTPHGAVFVTSEKPPHGSREYKVRYWDNVDGDTRSIKSAITHRDDAQAEARKVAKHLRSGADAETLFSEPY